MHVDTNPHYQQTPFQLNAMANSALSFAQSDGNQRKYGVLNASPMDMKGGHTMRFLHVTPWNSILGIGGICWENTVWKTENIDTNRYTIDGWTWWYGPIWRRIPAHGCHLMLHEHIFIECNTYPLSFSHSTNRNKKTSWVILIFELSRGTVESENFPASAAFCEE